MIRIYTSNRMEELSAMFRKNRKALFAEDVFAVETVVVQTRGTETYLREQIGLLPGGIAANIEFPYLKKFIDTVLEKNSCVSAPEFEPGMMEWKIYSILRGRGKDYPELAGYIENPDKPGLRCYQLASAAAHIFDQYEIYRCGMMSRWNSGAPDEKMSASESWQRRLWRELCPPEKIAQSRSGAMAEFLSIPDDRLIYDGRGFSVFASGAIPPVYMRILVKLASKCEVHFYYLKPSSEYWEDSARGGDDGNFGGNGAFSENANPLLVSCGGQCREFLGLLEDLAVSSSGENGEALFGRGGERFTDPGTDSVLHSLQKQILECRMPHDGELVSAPDDTVQIHSCCGPMREVQALHDILQDETSRRRVRPHEIIVMAPDIMEYLPYIRAVFDNGPLRGKYAFTDRSLAGTDSGMDAFSGVIDLLLSDFEVSKVLSLLENPVVCRSYGFSRGTAATVRTWVERAGICRGVDAGVPDGSGEKRRFFEYSWKHALRRILLSLAVDGDDSELTHLPSTSVPDEKIPPLQLLPSQDDAAAFGRFCGMMDTLFRLSEVIRLPKTAAEHAAFLRSIVSSFIAGGESPAGLRIFSGAFDGLEKAAACAGLAGEKIEWDIIGEYIDSHVRSAVNSNSYIHTKITFCSMTPLRSVPARVCVLLGMNQSSFPRRDTGKAFDMIREGKRELCDRSPALEDRMLFLEAMLSARDRFYIFYDGADPSGGENQPAIPLSELVFYLDRELLKNVNPASFSPFIVKHPLQPFDKKYFSNTDGRLFSYSPENLLVARSEETNRGFNSGAFSLVTDSPAPPCSGLPETDIADIVKFFKSPCEWYANARLGIPFHEYEAAVPEDVEPIAPDPSYDDKKRILKYLCGHGTDDLSPLYERMRCESAAGLGVPGMMNFKKCAGRLSSPDILAHSALYFSQRPRKFKIDCGDGVVVSGSISCSDDGTESVSGYFSDLKPKVLLSAFLQYLVLAAENGGNARMFYFAAGKKTSASGVFSGMDRNEAAGLLGFCARLVKEGGERPIPFFTGASYEYASVIPSGPAAARVMAEEKFKSDAKSSIFASGMFTPEMFYGNDPFGNDVFFNEFKSISEKVCAPLLKYKVADSAPKKTRGKK